MGPLKSILRGHAAALNSVAPTTDAFGAVELATETTTVAITAMKRVKVTQVTPAPHPSFPVPPTADAFLSVINVMVITTAVTTVMNPTVLPLNFFNDLKRALQILMSNL